MQELTKRHPTKIVELRVMVPENQIEAAKKALEPYCVQSGDNDAIPWREAFPDYGPNVAIRGARYREGLTQSQLAKKLGIAQSNLSAMERGTRPIGKDMAKRLADILNVDYRRFL